MAFNMRNDSIEELVEQHEINVTPFIDVMLVLLIIFMVAAPLATVSIPVNLPAAAVKASKVDDPMYLTLEKDSTLSLGDDVVDRELLADELMAKNISKEQPIFLRADSKVEYGELMAAMNLLAKAGYSKVALVGLEKTP
jgi:biopolymer transport protein ExbD